MSRPALFPDCDYPPITDLDAAARAAAARKRLMSRRSTRLDPTPDASLLEVYERAADPTDSRELLRLYLGRVEEQVGPVAGVPVRQDLIDAWRSSRRRRSVTPAEVLATRATVGLVKELFNSYFRDDLYGRLRSDSTVVLSSGSVDEELFGLPDALRDCIRFALDRDWYGYSDSRGRDASREAIARYETSRIDGVEYTLDNVCIGLGGTVLIGAVADFLIAGSAARSPVLCAIPNYPPLVQAIARRSEVRLVPVPVTGTGVDLQPLIDALRPDTPLVMLQTAMNPTGAGVADRDLARLLDAAGPDTMVILDECHEWLRQDPGTEPRASAVRGDPRVVRISSLAKTWSAPGLKVGWLVASRDFVDNFYEYSSTTFGGPSSFFYTMIEVLARMENWMGAGIEQVGPGQLAEFETSYGLSVGSLQRAFRRYVDQRRSRAAHLRDLRCASVGMLWERGVDALDPVYSINLAVNLGSPSDYTTFRRLLHGQEISVFPGILTMVLSSDVVRVTTARSWHDIRHGVTALADGLTNGAIRSPRARRDGLVSHVRHDST
ncbi:pyridoxal phosphate-dependent aminotransferase [Solwaraspora sp. WMMD1047]|uniref:pyridoxal phosphate-dependent aminotransferase n=1 Tax=Solwaraspora sp. WMMD1047 TaxID=3016102 RepID=UPI002415EFBA|nr:pyridoxal phosphate-dependent aminotransferase [Solwaraspora sp. WMMD1047]MDG4829590.1 pyridoxal phosphate-dependent aminotransferase [Solwaraspora sp. WMMD1047]